MLQQTDKIPEDIDNPSLQALETTNSSHKLRLLDPQHFQCQWQQHDHQTHILTLNKLRHTSTLHRLNRLRPFQGTRRILRGTGRQRQLHPALHGRRPKLSRIESDENCSREGTMDLLKEHTFGYSLARHTLEVIQGVREKTCELQIVPY